MHGDRSDQQHPDASKLARAERGAGGFVLSGDRPATMARGQYLCADLVIAGQFDTWSFPEDRAGLMRDLVHAPAKKSVLIPDATHFVLFEKNRMMFFEEILQFLKQ